MIAAATAQRKQKQYRWRSMEGALRDGCWGGLI
jgi:hypothetical protein